MWQLCKALGGLVFRGNHGREVVCGLNAARGGPGGRRQRTDAIVGWEQGGGKVEDEDSGKTVNKEKFRVLFCKLNFSPYS